MNGWVLYNETSEILRAESFELNRFRQVADQCGIELTVISPEQIDLVVTRDGRQSVLLDGKEVSLPDFLLPRMGAATTYFALAVIRHLERLGVQTFNSSQSIETVRDKLFTHQILAQSNLPVAKTMLAKFPVDVESVEKHLGLPVVVKTISGSQGTGVFLCESREHFEDLMQLVHATKSNVNIIIQEFVASSRGRDLRVLVVGGKAIACMKRSSNDGSFKANFTRGGSVEMFELTPEIEWLSSEASRLLGLDIAGIDLLFDGEHYKICEANSSPGFRGMESCVEVNVPEHIFSFICVRLGQLDKLPRVARVSNENTDIQASEQRAADDLA
ncbi:RimK family alpha-L-glutamate ligase [Rubripirellula sp.]|jgi:gamma-F420-2:alpha-L-glutamate ligase|nr:RimK family alpha-L-glutamate ligase [Planctomycetaceae bacterium]MDA9858595.1 RimK family alpha-L-glutamate ligase [Rubripirellula sp.]MDF1844394.1 RimK family alpha-L-glutamate ligase [Rubripirellula sp.]